ncbi:MAG: CHAD domain-containing protein [Xanthomonadales bacterium]|nr:CHAD domain-containing protein [Gammaproteobacteria bacterium]NNK32114.1 CHAD domain-containing protein [Xanthomonadales bacterium]NNK38925.1 CHAD domain-containing protein [Xanthomonadales bacterium]
MLKLTDEIERSAESLRQAYRPEVLYMFRVNSRRVRSILKHMGSHRSRSHRKTWGGFAAASNDARDWDVFLATAEKLLPSTEYRSFESLNAERVRAAHEAVTGMLETTHWQRHLGQWRDFLRTVDEHATDSDHSRAAVAAALERVRNALKTALAADDDHAWHRFRISVKELRYVTDALGDNDELVKACKKLQTLLGDWHDTVVQLNLLDELPGAPVHDRLADIVTGRKSDFLSRTRKLVIGHPVFDPEGSAES